MGGGFFEEEEEEEKLIKSRNGFWRGGFKLGGYVFEVRMGERQVTFYVSFALCIWW